MAKLGVYIPDGMMPEVEKWRGKINFSEVFMEALQRAIRRKELSEMTADEMKNLVNRLKLEKDDDFEAGREGAFEDGAEWAKSANLRALRKLCEVPDSAESIEEDEFFQIIDPQAELRNFAGVRHSVWEACEKDDCDWPTYVVGYMQGFIEGATSVWKHVCHQI